MNESVTFLEERISLAETALYEISCLADLVKKVDLEAEELAQVLPGMMTRIKSLSNAVTELHEPMLTKARAEKLWELVRCSRPSKEEVDSLLRETEKS